MRKFITPMAFTWFLLLAFAQQASCQEWTSKHGMSPAAYQEEFNDNDKKGFRLVSVTGYTSKGDERYAAIWNKKSGPEIATHHSMSSDSYQANFEKYDKLGYKLVSISGYAVNGNANFAAIWHKNARAPWAAKHNMTEAQYQAAVNDYDKQGYRLKFVNGYVVKGQEFFAAIWEKTTGGALVARHNLTAAKYQEAFEEFVGKGYDLKVVSGYEKNGTDLFAAIWEKTSGPHWSSRHAIPMFNYQHHFDNMFYQGYEAVYINAYAGNGTDNYNVIWENTNMKGADLAKLDAAIKGYMKSQGVNGMSVAVTKNGRLVYAKGTGFADVATKEELSPKHSMRIMSISKSVTATGIMKLMDQNKLTMNKKVFGPNGILSNYTIPDDKKDMEKITVTQLLHHVSGMRTGNLEKPFWSETATYDDVAKDLLARDDLMKSKPNTDFEYSNLGYFWLMMVIEKLSGQSYQTFIRNNVLTPAGVGQSMYVGLASGEGKPGESHYTPDNKQNMNNWAGFGGWVARPMDLVKFLGRYDGSPTPPDLISDATHDTMMVKIPLSGGKARGWDVSGERQGHRGANGASYSVLTEKEDGFSVAIIINSPHKDDSSLNKMLNEFFDAVKAVSAFPSYNLF